MDAVVAIVASATLASTHCSFCKFSFSRFSFSNVNFSKSNSSKGSFGKFSSLELVDVCVDDRLDVSSGAGLHELAARKFGRGVRTRRRRNVGCGSEVGRACDTRRRRARHVHTDARKSRTGSLSVA